MIKLPRYSLCAATAALSIASSGMAPASIVSPGDTFSIDAIGFNTADPTDNIFIIQPGLEPTFDTTNTYAGDALPFGGDHSLTVTSSESISGGIVTDTITATVPTNFVPAGTTDNGGNIINAVEFSIGNYLTGTNPLDFSMPLVSPVPTASITFTFNGTTTTEAVTEGPSFTNGNMSYSNETQLDSDSSTFPISNYDLTSFSFSVSYAVPESSTWAAMLVGAGLLGLTFRRRFRVA